jgi:hypothetical protein
MNIVQKTLIKSIRLYQKYISPDHSFWAKDNPPYCKHFPTCSEYMVESIKKRWAFFWLIKWTGRILRCMPWSKGWVDLVEKK